MGSCSLVQGAQLGALWSPRRWDGSEREGDSGGRVYMYTVTEPLPCTAKTNNIVKQLHANKKERENQSSL